MMPCFGLCAIFFCFCLGSVIPKWLIEGHKEAIDFRAHGFPDQTRATKHTPKKTPQKSSKGATSRKLQKQRKAFWVGVQRFRSPSKASNSKARSGKSGLERPFLQSEPPLPRLDAQRTPESLQEPQAGRVYPSSSCSRLSALEPPQTPNNFETLNVPRGPCDQKSINPKSGPKIGQQRLFSTKKKQGGGGGVGTDNGTGKSTRTRLSKLPFSDLPFSSSRTNTLVIRIITCNYFCFRVLIFWWLQFQLHFYPWPNWFSRNVTVLGKNPLLQLHLGIPRGINFPKITLTITCLICQNWIVIISAQTV